MLGSKSSKLKMYVYVQEVPIKQRKWQKESQVDVQGIPKIKERASQGKEGTKRCMPSKLTLERHGWNHKTRKS